MGEGSAAFRGQTALEYLMTYAWMIIIITIALTALYYLGVFNLANIAPKASSGACYVNRPQGPNTTAFVSLAGVCANEIPRLVATFSSASNIVIPNQYYLSSNAITVTFWLWEGKTSGSKVILDNVGNWAVHSNYNTCGGGAAVSVDFGPGAICDGWVSKGWHFIAASYSRATGTEYLYVNGTLVATQGGNRNAASSLPLVIGNVGGSSSFNGMLSNLQVYNATLSANDIDALYLEGIGGEPIAPQNIDAWYQLNGDAIDWSGNQNNGVANALSYTGQWQTNYTVP